MTESFTADRAAVSAKYQLDAWRGRGRRPVRLKVREAVPYSSLALRPLDFGRVDV